VISYLLKFYKAHISLESQKLQRCEVKTIESSKINSELRSYDDNQQKYGRDLPDEKSVVLQFGIQSLAPNNILEVFELNERYIDKSVLFEQLNGIINRDKQNNPTQEQDNLLDFSDFEDDFRIDQKQVKFMLDVLDVISFTSVFPNVSYEITPILKMKIADLSMSQLLINKPAYPDVKLKSLTMGYLTIDTNSRLVPFDSKECSKAS
jgi:hypothetical protein